MPENIENSAAAEVEPQTTPPTFEAITSQEDLDKIIQKRVAREQKKYADYEELAAKAARFDESVEASKPELQKATERAEQAEAELAAHKLEVERYQIIAEAGLPADLHALVTGSTAEEIRMQAEKLAALTAPSANLHHVVSTDGKIPDRKPKTPGRLFEEAFKDRI